MIGNIFGSGAEKLPGGYMGLKGAAKEAEQLSLESLCTLAAHIYAAPVAALGIFGKPKDPATGDAGALMSIIHDPTGCLPIINRSATALVVDPAAASDFGMQFYFSVPIRNQDGLEIGTLTVMAPQARLDQPLNKAPLCLLAQIVAEIVES